MSAANIVIGLAMGLPMMIAVGPISVLLLDQGLERGVRAAAPAALGVAGADLTLATLAAFGGSSLARSLGPFTPMLTLVAVGVLLVLAIGMARSALAEIRSARRATDAGADSGHGLHSGAVPVHAPVGVGATAPTQGLATSAFGSSDPGSMDTDEHVRSGVEPTGDGRPTGAAFSRFEGLRLAAAFYGLTFVNPLTLVLFASVVVAGGTGVGTMGWALGMALSSLLAHGGFVVIGGALGTRLSPVASGRLRLGAAAFMGLLAVYFAVGS